MSRGGARGAVQAVNPASLDALLPRALGAAVDQFASRSKRKAARRLLEAMGPTRKRVMQMLWETVKEAATKDPDMPGRVKAQVRNVIDSIADDVERQTEEKLLLTTGTRANLDAAVQWQLRQGSEPPKRCCLSRWCSSFCRRLRGRLLYAISPSDKTIWGSLRDPLWWMFVVLSMCTAFLVRTIVFTLLLLLLTCGGRPDEYQLTKFILVLKANQFFTAGVGCMLVTSMQYYYCLMFTKQELVTCLSIASVRGPFVLWYCSLDYITSFVLPQLAKLAFYRAKRLRPSLSATGFEFRDPEPEPMQCCGCCQIAHPAPWRLRLAMRYDSLCFVASAAALVLLTALTSRHDSDLYRLVCDPVVDPDCSHHDPSLALNAYWCRELYALSAFPFVLAWAPDWTPVSFSLITRASRTGFDRDGRIVLFGLRTRAERRHSGSDSDDSNEFLGRGGSATDSSSEEESCASVSTNEMLVGNRPRRGGGGGGGGGWFSWRYMC